MGKSAETADSKPLSRSIKFGVPVGIVIVIIFLWAITPGVAFWFFRIYSVEKPSGTPTFEDLGVVGDSFGLMNALFSGGALVGVIVAIFLQSRELKLMHVEMRGQKEQLEGQRLALERSNLDDTFFQILRLRSDIISGLARTDRTGYEFFNDQWISLGDRTNRWVSKAEDNNIKDFKGL
ncbi:MAG: hypothetical protein QGD90_01350, partial [Candidatus Hydrogenedentes bacterium]|nr:hypothetical protein [Candidatus Hydrogenedentota bacterium]